MNKWTKLEKNAMIKENVQNWKNCEKCTKLEKCTKIYKNVQNWKNGIKWIKWTTLKK